MRHTYVDPFTRLKDNRSKAVYEASKRESLYTQFTIRRLHPIKGLKFVFIFCLLHLAVFSQMQIPDLELDEMKNVQNRELINQSDGLPSYIIKSWHCNLISS